MFTVVPSGDQLRLFMVEYVTKKLAGKPAEFAGDEALHDQERVFGWIQAETETDTLRWHLQRPDAERQKLKAGLPPEREAAVLAAWKGAAKSG